MISQGLYVFLFPPAFKAGHRSRRGGSLYAKLSRKVRHSRGIKPSGSLRSLPILHLLPTSLFHLLLSLAVGTRCTPLPSISTPKARKPTPDSHKRTIRQPNRINRDNNPKPPSPVTQHTNRPDTPPRPVQNIPHVLGQAGRAQVLAGRPERAICGVGWAADAVEVEFDEKSWDAEQVVWF